MQQEKKAKIDFLVFKRLLHYAKPYKRFLVFSLLFTIGLSILSPLRPSIIGNMVDEYIVKNPDADQLLFWTLIVIGMLVAEGFFQYFNSYYSNLLAQSVIHDMRKKLYQHFMAFKMKYFDKTPIGTVVTRVVADLEAISEVFSQGIINMLGDLLILITVLGWMFYTDFTLSLVILIPIPLLLIATRIFAKAMKKAFQKERLEVQRLNTFVQERLTGMAVLQMFNRQKVEYKKFEAINNQHRQAHMDTIWANSIFFPVVEFLSSLSIAFLIVYSAWYMTQSPSSDVSVTGNIIKYTLWVYMLFRPIRQLADKFNILQRGVVRAERVFQTLDTDAQIQDEGTIAKCDFQQPIVFDKVWFAYQDEDWVLKNIQLTIEPNTTVAFVGATGAGKTSIINLLSRFYEYQKGQIRIGDTDLKDLELKYLRQNIAIVLQDVFLFSDSIYNNISLGNASITKAQVITAAKAVGAHEFIMRLPNNYDYQVGERGGVLSVGQRQLLAFIRAYVYNPHILILDEATSSVDNESEALIQKATEKLTVGRTSIVIAHRLSTIQKANKIIVLEKGEIVETGDHFSLLAQNGYYKKLYEKQFLNNTNNND
ncbi:MAG: ABC transporter ATP-binding protein [Crocinitomicaceae bacterium]|nr:ABC transporter ATP-binding protein [Crocinitomicaceae bacterium]